MYPNRVALSNDKGHTSIVSIARAKAIGTLQEDFSIGREGVVCNYQSVH